MKCFNAFKRFMITIFIYTWSVYNYEDKWNFVFLQILLKKIV